jgi:alpha-2-macroglobulin
MQVIGKRHYGRKALPHGGGGGRRAARELFDTLLLWKGRVLLDEQGEARIEVPLNDSLTSFRIVAVGSAASDLFGSGSTAVRTTQDLMLISGLPRWFARKTVSAAVSPCETRAKRPWR